MEKLSRTERHNRYLLETLWDLTENWIEQFENPPEFPFSFDLEESDSLYFGGKKLCQISDWICIDRYDYDTDYFTFVILSRDPYGPLRERYTFLVDWPYNSPIRSVEVLKNGFRLFLCESPEYTKTKEGVTLT